MPFGRGLITNIDRNSKLTCHGHVRRYGVYFCKLPAVLRTAFNNLSEMQRKRVQVKLREYGYGKAIDGLYGKGIEEALMIFNKRCFDDDLTRSKRSNKLIQAVQKLRPVSKSGRQDNYEIASGIDHYASGDVCTDHKVISSEK